MAVTDKADIYLVGSKCIGQYGGYESFVQKLLEYHRENKTIQYHVACKENGDGHMVVSKLLGASQVKEKRFTYCNADCFLINVPTWLKSAQAIFYDVMALKECCRHIEKNHIQNPVVYIMACRIGPFIKRYVKKIHSLGGKVYLNPDGHEWKRAKWSAPVRRYWKESERLMVKAADLIICDSVNIERYIQTEYKKYNPVTEYIAYGAEIRSSQLSDDNSKYVEWMRKHAISSTYFTVVGRCVPENNFEPIIREFMNSKTDKDLVIITTENTRFLQEMENRLHYSKDKRIKFVGTVYDQELLKKIREKSYGYFHGHSVGGTNPSLLEALGSTKLNLLYNVCFNREVAQDSALYWELDKGSLSRLIDHVTQMAPDEIDEYGRRAKQRIRDAYSWQFVCDRYADIFLNRA